MKKRINPSPPTVQQLEAELKREKRRRRFRDALRGTVSTLVVVAAAAVLISNLLLPVLKIYGFSMMPTLVNGNIVVALQEGTYERGDVIAFYYNNKILVKRVIGLPGEWIDIDENGNVSIDGTPLNEPYLAEKALGECDIKKEARLLLYLDTDTLESVYRIDPDNIKHIHGYVKNKKEELVIGHCNQKVISYALEKKKEAEINFIDFEISTFDRVSKYCDATLKRTRRIIDENADFFKSLSNVNEVIIIGHSLNIVDMPYFKKVFNSISENAIWKAYYFEDTDKKPFEKVLDDLGIREENRFVRKTQELYL